MKILVRETVSHFHEVELSDELDVEQVLNMSNALRNRYNTGYEAIEAVLQTYKDKHGDAFDYEVKPNYCGAKCESIDYETVLEE